MRAEQVQRASTVFGVIGLTLLSTASLRLAVGGATPPQRGQPHSQAGQAARPTPTPPPDLPDHLIGVADVETVEARSAPSEDAEVVASFPQMNSYGARQSFLLLSEERSPSGDLPAGKKWVKALLPVRPNGTTAFLRTDDLEIVGTDFRILVDRQHFRLTVFENNDVVMSTPVGIGTGATPTPVGNFYLTSLVEPPTNTSVYGSYAYGLSAFSEQLTDWVGGGVIGLHGTNDPTSVGREVSAGCIRMRNEDIERLVPMLPLGTPIEII